TGCPGRIEISPGASSSWATSGSEFRGLSAAGGTVAGDLRLDHAEQAGDLAAGQAPMLRGVRDDLDESEIRILTAVEPGIGRFGPQFVDRGRVVDELDAAGHGEPVARLGDADVDLWVRPQRLGLVAVEGEEEPDVGILGDLLRGHRMRENLAVGQGLASITELLPRRILITSAWPSSFVAASPAGLFPAPPGAWPPSVSSLAETPPEAEVLPVDEPPDAVALSE